MTPSERDWMYDLCEALSVIGVLWLAASLVSYAMVSCGVTP